MKTVLYYYSMTGNTTLACESIAGCFGSGLELRDIRLDPQPLSDDTVLIGLAFPTHYMGLPQAVQSFLQKSGDLSGRPVFLLNTYGMMPGRALLQAKELLDTMDCRLVAWHALNMPEGYPPFVAKGWDSKDKPDKKQLEAFGCFVRELSGIGDTLARGGAVPEAKMKLDFFSRIMTVKPRQKILKEMGALSLNSERCTRCGQCAASCPAGAIRLSLLPEFDEGQCVGCWACYNTCKADAISAGKTPAGSRYGGPDETLRKKISTGKGRIAL